MRMKWLFCKSTSRIACLSIQGARTGEGISLSQEEQPGLDILREFYGPNAGYAIELYERYRDDPNAVDEHTRSLFSTISDETMDRIIKEEGASRQGDTSVMPVGGVSDPNFVAKVVKARQLARNIREFGHLQARFDPLGISPRRVVDDPEVLGLQDDDLKTLPSTIAWSKDPKPPGTALDAINRLRQVYSGPLGYDFSHVHNFDERDWLRTTVESGTLDQPLSQEEKRSLLNRLTEVEVFERFLHTNFPGQKRFSIEGTDSLVPMLDELIILSARTGSREVVMGMAHRGRLNVLAHVLGKPYLKIFSEFHTAINKDLVPSEGSRGINSGWTGDVKYHLGAHKMVHERDLVEVRITLANNPSHLEFVNPVIEGATRAAQEDAHGPGFPEQDVERALAILIHGDAAFPGEGVVAETLNLSRLRGYHTGGTIHIIMNNGLGFTTSPRDGRSTLYASDLAKGFEIPIVHVNADDPEACLTAIRIAHAYRTIFHKDFLIDLVGYRRWGHNEGDEPAFTHPRLYRAIADHPTVRTIYRDGLIGQNIVSELDAEAMAARVQATLQHAKEQLNGGILEDDDHLIPNQFPPLPSDTGVSADKLRALNDALLARPADFHPNPKLDRQLQRRREAMEKPGAIDWGMAEALAFATILADGTPIRLTGQDSERGTFSHRHSVLHDTDNGATYTPLQHLPQAKASFAVYNSPLSEAAVLGFEYGYSVESPHTLTIWEAQFGDFANAAQVLIDQFIAAGRSKWKEVSGLILLLPHGYEGQGPEHSSGRVERFLQLSGNGNMRVANCTTSAQYFHLLRQQAKLLKTDPHPLVIMTPKSLLRHPLAASSLADLAQGKFHAVLDDLSATDHLASVQRLVFCSGKVAVDLMSARKTEAKPSDHVALVRVEQLYPFPAEDIRHILQKYPAVDEVVWMQEEPKNMGAWRYIEPLLRSEIPARIPLVYLGRPERAAAAEGIAEMHTQEQARLVNEALFTSKVSTQGGRQ